MTEQEQAIENIASALKKVLACDPQLLYKAAQKVYGDTLLECIISGLESKPKKTETLRSRAQIALMIGNLLVRSGRAHLDTDDVANMAAYSRFMREDTENG